MKTPPYVDTRSIPEKLAQCPCERCREPSFAEQFDARLKQCTLEAEVNGDGTLTITLSPPHEIVALSPEAFARQTT